MGRIAAKMIQAHDSRLLRWGLLAFAMALAIGPFALTVGRGLGLGLISSAVWEDVFYKPVYATAWRSVELLLATAGIASLASMWLAIRLTRALPGFRYASLFVLLFPLLLPPFLWSIGFQNLKPVLPYSEQRWLDGFGGSLLAGLTFAIPFAALVAYLAARFVPRSALESALLAGGETALAKLQFRRIAPASAGASLLAAILALFDVGVGNITGYHTISGDILIALSARTDLALAVAKSLYFLAILAPVLALALWLILRSLSIRELGRQFLSRDRLPSHSQSDSGPIGSVITLILSGALLFTAGYGLLRPLTSPPIDAFVASAWSLLLESLPTTLIHAGAAGTTGAGLGMLIALLLPPRAVRSFLLPVALVVVFATPPALHALGIVWFRSIVPSWLELSESSVLVGIGLGLRLTPLGVLIGLLAVWRLPRSLVDGADVCGVPPAVRLWRLYLPQLAPALLFAVVLLGALALSDISSSMLLQVPGESSFGNHLFARMDNSPEKLIAAMCLLYSLPGIVVLGTLLTAILIRKLTRYFGRIRHSHPSH